MATFSVHENELIQKAESMKKVADKSCRDSDLDCLFQLHGCSLHHAGGVQDMSIKLKRWDKRVGSICHWMDEYSEKNKWPKTK